MEIIIDNRAAFDAATRVFVLAPNQDTLLLLNMATSRMFNVISSDVIAAAAAAEDFREPSSNDFSAFRATFDRPLSAAEQNEAGAAIGYALRI
ncbi:MAG: hypothetical protein H8F28_18330, partial [Fibrella sp.]|nr:hypothetical protein [Armatimonadota bacterium]